MKTATNPETGEKVIYIDGTWSEYTQSATNDAGERAYLVDGEWKQSGQKQSEKPFEQNPLDPRDYNPVSLKNIAGTIIEPGLALGTSGLAASKGGWDALNAYMKNELIGRGMEGEISDPKQMTANAIERYGYKPRTPGGQAVTEAISAPLQAYGEKGREFGDRAEKATGSKLYGAGTEAVWNLAPMVLGAKNPKGRYPQTKQNPVVEAIANRLPGGTKHAAKEIITETAGPRIRGVRDELIAADKRLTAGQATAPAGSYETSALFKMAERQDPSAYGAIRKGQESGRIGELRTEAKPVETQQFMENIRGGVANKLYDAARTGKIEAATVKPVVSKIDRLIKDNPGNSEFITEMNKVKKGLVDSKSKIRTDAKQVFSSVDGLRIALERKEYGPIKGQLGELKKDIAGLSDKYKQAEKFYAETSRPLTQMGIFQELIDTLTPKLGSKEKATQYANAITGRTQALTMKKAAGKKPIKGEFKAALKPEQSSLINRIGDELNNNAIYSEQAALGAAKMNEIAGTMWNSPKFNIFERTMVVINTIVKRIEGRNAKVTLDKIAELGKPENRAELIKIIEAAMPEELALLQESSLRLGRLAPGAIAGQQENE